MNPSFPFLSSICTRKGRGVRKLQICLHLAYSLGAEVHEFLTKQTDRIGSVISPQGSAAPDQRFSVLVTPVLDNPPICPAKREQKTSSIYFRQVHTTLCCECASLPFQGQQDFLLTGKKIIQKISGASTAQKPQMMVISAQFLNGQQKQVLICVHRCCHLHGLVCYPCGGIFRRFGA